MEQMKNVGVALGLFLALGCGQSAVVETRELASVLDGPGATSGGEIAVGGFDAAEFAPGDDWDGEWDEDAFALAELPAAPWSATPLVAEALPASLAAVWASADDEAGACAPLAFADAAGATPRASALAGGWSIEFDEAGAPGMDEAGERCSDCGRASFGVAGTTIDAERANPSFDDGSTLVREDADGVATASVRIDGTDCVYQVWSFRGEAHLDALIQGMRRVSLPAAPTNVATR